MENIFIEFLPPWVETGLQPAFYDKESGTVLQQVSRMYAKINELIKSNNKLTTDFKNLHDYVYDYFDNLDVQEEINNKLDDMAEGGELADIINQEIFGEINDRLDLLDQKKYIIIGDSYCEGWTPDGDVESWGTKLKNKLGLTNANCTIAYLGGTGFSNPTAYFSTILNGLTADNDVTDIIVCGGYNDKSASASAIYTGMQAFATVADTKFPNAKIHVGFIGFSNVPSDRNNFRNTAINYYTCCESFAKMSYLTNVEYSLKNVFRHFSSDGIHPNADGQNAIAENVKNALVSGSADEKIGYMSMHISPASRWDIEHSNLDEIGTSVINGCTFVENTATSINLKTSTAFDWVGSGGANIEIGTITDGSIVGNGYSTLAIPVNLILKTTESGTNYVQASGIIKFEGTKAYLAYTEASGGNFVTHTVTDVQIKTFSGCFNSLFC